MCELRRASLLRIAIAGLCLLSAGALASADPFPGRGRDAFNSTAAVRITDLNGNVIVQTILGSLEDIDEEGNTVVDRSDPFQQGSVLDAKGAPVGPAGMSDPHIVADKDIPIFPEIFTGPFDPPGVDPGVPPREVHTEIVSLDLSGGGLRLRAGRDHSNLFPAGFAYRSLGEVESKSSIGDPNDDFPANSFFVVFFVMDAPNPMTGEADQFFNKEPFLLECSGDLPNAVEEFPPKCKYLHTLGEDQMGSGIQLFDVENPNGGPVAILASAVHGAQVEAQLDDLSVIELASFTAKVSVGGNVILVWETTTEIDNAGFNLYRSEVEGGPYTVINDALIPAQGGPVSGASYSFVDTPGSGTFYYQLEDVDYNGVSTLHGPVEVTVFP